MKKTIFVGSGVALVTPFTEQNEIDFEKIDKLVEFHVQNSTDAIIVCGTTGEASAMTEEEQVKVVSRVLKGVASRIPVIAGAGSNNTLHAVHMSKRMQEIGADAILSVVPYYNKPTQMGLKRHFEFIATSINIPVILYNVPSRTSLNMEAATISELSQIENIVAVKECNLAQVGDIINTCAEGFTVYSGNDDQVLPLLSLGGKGIISVVANIIPQDIHDMVHRFLHGDVGGSRKLQLKILELVKALFIESNPVPVKTAMNLIGIEVGKSRLPLVDMNEKNISILTTALKNYGL